MSLDDVRRYLLDTGADAEAERVLLGGSNESPTKPSVAKPTAPNASIYSNPRSMYEQLIWEKERERDELLNKLLLEENMSQENAKKEEEELARLAVSPVTVFDRIEFCVVEAHRSLSLYL